MKEQGIIDGETFGVYFIDINYGSDITFDGFDTERVLSIDNLTFTDFYDDNYQSARITLMRYGDVEIGGQARRGVIDTGYHF